MRKHFFTMLAFVLFLPTHYLAKSSNSFNTNELKIVKQKKKKTAKKSKSKKTYSKSNGCTYEGHTLYVGKRGGCYYMADNSKEYVDRSYCSGCN